MSSPDNSRVTKVCFIAPKAYPLFNRDVKEMFGGAEMDLYLLSTELAKDKDFAVNFITADYGQANTEKIEGIRLIKSVNFNKNPLSGAVRIWQAMHNADSHIYFQEAVSWGTFLVALFSKLHKRIFIYRTANQGESDGTFPQGKRFLKRAFRWSLRNAAQVIVQNETDQKKLKQTTGIGSKVMGCGHQLPILSERKRDIILWVGRSAKIKRPELFIDLAEKTPNERFTMICRRATGDKNYEEMVRRAKTIENLDFLKQVEFDEIENYFARAKFFVCTSKGEGFPNTYIEACKNGTPILSLNVNPDNFLSRFNCGICADDDWERFVQQLRTMLESDKLREYGQNARKYAEQKHDIKKIINRFKELFKDLVKYRDTTDG
jgi:glycosyltransferase involved in cell wall biosynthesis